MPLLISQSENEVKYFKTAEHLNDELGHYESESQYGPGDIVLFEDGTSSELFFNPDIPSFYQNDPVKENFEDILLQLRSIEHSREIDWQTINTWEDVFTTFETIQEQDIKQGGYYVLGCATTVFLLLVILIIYLIS